MLRLLQHHSNNFQLTLVKLTKLFDGKFDSGHIM